MLSAVASLCRKYQKANDTVETMNSAADELTGSIANKRWISEWKKLEEAARVERGEALMVYNVSHVPGMFLTWVVIFLHSLHNGQLHHRRGSSKISRRPVQRARMFSGY